LLCQQLWRGVDEAPSAIAGFQRRRRKQTLQRNRLQKQGTKGAKKTLKRVSDEEARFGKRLNHIISKAMAEAAKGNGRGIAVEELDGIGDRLLAWGKDALDKHSWCSVGRSTNSSRSSRLRARLAGVPLVQVAPREHIEKMPHMWALRAGISNQTRPIPVRVMRSSCARGGEHLPMYPIKGSGLP